MTMAVFHKNKDAIKIILEKAPHLLTESDENGWTAVTIAAGYENVDIINVILENAPHLLTESDENGKNTLTLAFQAVQIGIAKAILGGPPHLAPHLLKNQLIILGILVGLHILLKKHQIYALRYGRDYRRNLIDLTFPTSLESSQIGTITLNGEIIISEGDLNHPANIKNQVFEFILSKSNQLNPEPMMTQAQWNIIYYIYKHALKFNLIFLILVQSHIKN